MKPMKISNAGVQNMTKTISSMPSGHTWNRSIPFLGKGYGLSLVKGESTPDQDFSRHFGPVTSGGSVVKKRGRVNLYQPHCISKRAIMALFFYPNPYIRSMFRKLIGRLHISASFEKDLSELLNLLAQGKIKPVISERMPLTEVRAHMKSLKRQGLREKSC